MWLQFEGSISPEEVGEWMVVRENIRFPKECVVKTTDSSILLEGPLTVIQDEETFVIRFVKQGSVVNVPIKEIQSVHEWKVGRADRKKWNGTT